MLTYQPKLNTSVLKEGIKKFKNVKNDTFF